jgi:hypothetical protein
MSLSAFTPPRTACDTILVPSAGFVECDALPIEFSDSTRLRAVRVVLLGYTITEERQRRGATRAAARRSSSSDHGH